MAKVLKSFGFVSFINHACCQLINELKHENQWAFFRRVTVGFASVPFLTPPFEPFICFASLNFWHDQT